MEIANDCDDVADRLNELERDVRGIKKNSTALERIVRRLKCRKRGSI